MWCYSNTCINNGLIRLNKFISRFTDEFYNLLFISIRIFHTTFLYNIRSDVTLQDRRLHQKQASSFYFLFIRTAPLTYIHWPRAQGRPRPGFCPLLEKLCACGALTVTERDQRYRECVCQALAIHPPCRACCLGSSGFIS